MARLIPVAERAFLQGAHAAGFFPALEIRRGPGGRETLPTRPSRSDLESDLEPLVQQWRERGLIRQPITDLTSLVNIGTARTNFLICLEEHSGAWDELVASCMTLKVGRLDEIDRGEDYELTPAQATVRHRWLSAYGLDVPWMREWVQRAVVLVSDHLHQHGAEAVVPILDILTVGYLGDGLPEPHYVSTLHHMDGGRMFAEWDPDDEPPPNPIGESKAQFLERMNEAWDKRTTAIKPSHMKREAFKHAAWFVRVHVGREPVSRIVDEEELRDADTKFRRTVVDKALKAFSTLIELPLSRPQRLPKGGAPTRRK